MNTNPRRPDQPVDHQDLAELLPAPGRPVLRRDRHRVLREHLMEQISSETVYELAGTTDTSPALPAPRRPRRRLVLIAAPLALAAAVVVGAVAVDGVRDGKGGATATGVSGDPRAEHRQAVQLLDRIAVVAADRPAVTVRDDQYIYTKSQGPSAMWGGPSKPVRDSKGDITGTRRYKGNVQSDEWQPVPGKRDGLRRLTALSPNGEPDPSQTQDIAMSPGGIPSFRQLQALPTDPDALLKKLTSGSGVVKSRLTETVFENAGAILDQATLLPDLNAALYRAMAKLPDVRVVENVKDGAGRTGIGLTYTNRRNPSKTTSGYWVFDAKSLAYLGTDRSALLDVAVTDDKGKVTAVGAS
ncbi:CU044_5270 family protein [Streptomyces sp. NPDC059455]|uniref:CU044_5270 family protein n=1 Tax=Streptomyces sp. NPDC059455 TaxID=3346837 RepID=UPI0036CCCBAE